MENVKNDAFCHVTRQNQYNPAGGGATKIYIPNITNQLFLAEIVNPKLHHGLFGEIITLGQKISSLSIFGPYFYTIIQNGKVLYLSFGTC